MNRTEFFDIARARGWEPGKRLTSAQRTSIVFALRAQLTEAALRDTRIHETQSPREMTAMEAVKLLLEELE